MTHDDLVQTAGRWLRNHERCTVVFCEPTFHTDEMPDAIGFKGGISTVIECKLTRADALSEPRKPWRRWSDGMGNRRYFMVPEHIALGLTDWVQLTFPDHGLLAAGRRRRVETVKPAALARSLSEYAVREERHILEKAFQRLQTNRRFVTKTGRFERWEDFARRQAG